MDSPIEIEDDHGSAAVAPATSPIPTPPRKKVRAEDIALPDLDTSEPPNAQHLVQITHALQRMESNIGQKLDMIQAQQKTITETVDQHTAQLAINHDEISSIKDRIQHFENDTKAPPQLEKLELQVQGLTQKVQEILHQRSSSAPPLTKHEPSPMHPRASTLSPSRPRPNHSNSLQSADPEADWNRLVIGGWHTDTRREKIEHEARQLLQTFGIADAVTDVIVYGRRASACHILLRPLPSQDARRRLTECQTQHKDKHIIPSSGKTAWMTPHKSAHKRLKNRATKYAVNILEPLLDNTGKETLDIDWNKQIIWVRDLRVVAFSKTDLMMPPDNQAHQANYQDPRHQDVLPFFFDLYRLAKATGKEIPELKRVLPGPQPE